MLVTTKIGDSLLTVVEFAAAAAAAAAPFAPFAPFASFAPFSPFLPFSPFSPFSPFAFFPVALLTSCAAEVLPFTDGCKQMTKHRRNFTNQWPLLPLVRERKSH
jgi:hypothetical protein